MRILVVSTSIRVPGTHGGSTHVSELVAALRAGTRLQYDGANMRVTNSVAANDYLTRVYRKGFELS